MYKGFIRTLKGKIFIVLMLVLLFACGVIFVNGRTAQDSWRRQRIGEVEKQVNIYATTLDISFSLMESMLGNLPVNNEHYDRLLRLSREHKTDTLEYWQSVVDIRKRLEQVISSNEYVENVFVYFPGMDLFVMSGVNPGMTEIIRANSPGAPGMDADSWKCVRLSETNYLYRVYNFGDYQIGAWFSCDALQSSLVKLDKDSGNPIFVADMSGALLTDGAPFTEFIPDSGSSVLDDGRNAVIYEPVHHPGIYVGQILTKENLSPQGMSIFQNMTMIVFLLLLMIVCVFAGLSHWVARPLRGLVQGIDKIGEGDIDYRLHDRPDDSLEFQQITQRFNAIMDQLAHMRIRIYEQQMEQQETKLRYLGQQIQPHFILNSLNTLYTYNRKDTETAQKIIRLLSSYYRYVVNAESSYVQLIQELEHIENYLHLQKIRYPRTMEYAVTCEEALKIVPIPPFLIESFVGNAIKHGLNGEDPVMIRVDAAQIGTFMLRIRISDTGVGFRGDVLEALKALADRGEVDESLGVGIRNSIERLRLIYKERAEICFYNQESHGAVVDIKIQLQDEEIEYDRE